jgi:probable addiction module antidote protein
MSGKIILTTFDAAEYLDTGEAIAAYLSESFASNDPAEIAEAIGTVARARGMTEVARQAGVSRESLYRALSRHGNPELSTMMGVLKACGVRLTAAPAAGPRRATRARKRRRKAA